MSVPMNAILTTSMVEEVPASSFLSTADAATLLLATADVQLIEDTCAKWTEPLKASFIECIMVEFNQGVFTDNNFKSTHWKKIHAMFIQRNKVNFTTTQFHSQWSSLKKDYGIFKSLKEQSGFGWNSDEKIVTAPEETLDTGKYASSSDSSPPEDNQPLVTPLEKPKRGRFSVSASSNSRTPKKNRTEMILDTINRLGENKENVDHSECFEMFNNFVEEYELELSNSEKVGFKMAIINKPEYDKFFKELPLDEKKEFINRIVNI